MHQGAECGWEVPLAVHEHGVGEGNGEGGHQQVGHGQVDQVLANHFGSTTTATVLSIWCHGTSTTTMIILLGALGRWPTGRCGPGRVRSMYDQECDQVGGQRQGCSASVQRYDVNMVLGGYGLKVGTIHHDRAEVGHVRTGRIELLGQPDKVHDDRSNSEDFNSFLEANKKMFSLGLIQCSALITRFHRGNFKVTRRCFFKLTMLQGNNDI